MNRALLAVVLTVTMTAKTSNVAFAAPPSAGEETNRVCVAASENAQHLRNAGKLSAARVELAICSKPECPKLVRDDCGLWSSEVSTAFPSVVFAAKDSAGRDLVDVRVYADGKQVATSLHGVAVDVDPGPHTLRFETDGAPPVEQKIVTNEGVKNRVVTATFAPGTSAVASSKRPFPIVPIVLGGVGIVGVGVGTYFGLESNDDVRAAVRDCKPTCPQETTDEINSKRLVAGLAIGVGSALIVTGVVLYLLQGKSNASSTSSALLQGGVIRF